MKQIMAALLILAGICAFGLTCRFPAMACALWILALETSPDSWLAKLIGGHETIIGAMKTFGLLLAAVLALRAGLDRDRYNPAFAFFLMFCAGLMHGLYPGLSPLSSVRSLLGSATPFLFGFLCLPSSFVRAVKFCAIAGPAFHRRFRRPAGARRARSHVRDRTRRACGSARSGEPPFLAGFALIGVYAASWNVSTRARAPGFAALNLLDHPAHRGARAAAAGPGAHRFGLGAAAPADAAGRPGGPLASAVMFGPALTTSA